MADLYNGWDYIGNSIGDGFKAFYNWFKSQTSGVAESIFKNFTGSNFDEIKNSLSKLFNGLTGEASARAMLEANTMNIANQNYWNEITMQREDTAHQREVADLQAAGLNPWLSVGGNGAQSVAMNTAEAQPVDGSKILMATSSMALVALTKLLMKKI